MMSSSSIHDLSALAYDPNGPRAKLDTALRNVAQWPDQDQRFFVATFTSNRSEPEIAKKLGLSTDNYQTKHRELMRRFMRAVQPDPGVQSSVALA